MKYNKALSWLPALLMLGGCTTPPPEPPGPPVKTPQLGEVTVTCAPTALVLGQSTQCSASAVDQDGQPLSIEQYAWTSSDETVAQVDATGKATPTSPGTVAIRASATLGDVTRQGQASLSVSQKEPTRHDSDITTNQTWSRTDSPHQVHGQISVRDSATLTLEKGAVVIFTPDAELRVAEGALVASGTATESIQLVAPDAAAQGAWRGLVFASEGGSSRLEHVTLRGCGESSGEGACLVLRGKAAPVLQDVSVDKSGSAGVFVADDGSAFGPGSARLSISGSTGYAVRMGANHADSFPAQSSFTGNGRDAVELTGNITRTLTWPTLPSNGVFVINGLMILGDDALPDETVLTLPAGAKVRVGTESELTAARDAKWGFISAGTAEAPVLITADAEDPQPGHWRGIHLALRNSNTVRISHTTIQYAGLPGAGTMYLNDGTGNLNLYGQSDASSSANVVLSDLTLAHSSAHGLYMNDMGFHAESARLTSRDNAMQALLMSPDFVGTLPTTLTFTGNGIPGVELHNAAVTRTQTWRNLGPGQPYFIKHSLHVGYLTSSSLPPPTLTIEPGTEIRFSPEGAITVGYRASQPGVLIAKGTTESPIRLVPDVERRGYGYWKGLHFWKADNSELDYVVIEEGGRAGDASEGNIGTGNLNVYREIGSFMTHSTLIRPGGGCTVTVNKRTNRPEATVVTTNFLDDINGNNFPDTKVQCSN